MIFRGGGRTSIAKEPYSFVIFRRAGGGGGVRGGGGSDPLSPDEKWVRDISKFDLRLSMQRDKSMLKQATMSLHIEKGS